MDWIEPSPDGLIAKTFLPDCKDSSHYIMSFDQFLESLAKIAIYRDVGHQDSGTSLIGMFELMSGQSLTGP